MEKIINSIAAGLAALYQSISPVYWGVFLAVLAVLGVMIIIKRRRAKPYAAHDLPPVETIPPPTDPPASPSPPKVDPHVDAHTDSHVDAHIDAPADQPVEPAAEQTTDPPRKTNLLDRLKTGLSKTRQFLSGDIEALFRGRRHLDDDLLESLEELLITADIGVQTSMDLIEHIAGQSTKISTPADLKTVLKSEILKILHTQPEIQVSRPVSPRVVMVVGVNGVGKTTTIGKLAHKYRAGGRKTLIAAADTFRAAAVEQLAVWAQRAGADLVKHSGHADPAAVAYDGVEAAMARGVDVVFIDTAGRLHTKINLMEELKKIKRTIAKKLPGAPHDIFLVIDATTGQNALAQARQFKEALDITGIVLTKVDGTAKGGIVVGICREMDIPLNYIGVGENIDDLQVFDADRFVKALF